MYLREIQLKNRVVNSARAANSLALFTVLLLGSCQANICLAQGEESGQARPLFNSKSIWETDPTQQNPTAPASSQPKTAVQAQRPLSLPASHLGRGEYFNSAIPQPIVPAAFEEIQVAKQVHNPAPAVSTRPALRLRKPGEKNVADAAKTDPGKRRLGSTSKQLGTTTLVLGGIVIVILVTSRLMKKHTSLGGLNLSSEVLEVLGRKMLDQKHAIHYVHCGNKILVLGTSLEGIRTLAEITDPVEIDRIRGECKPIAEETPLARSFGFLLSKTGRDSQQVDVDEQHRKKQRKRRRPKQKLRDKDEMPAPNLADFGLPMNAGRERRS